MSFGSLFLASATLTFMILILAIFDGYVNSSAQETQEVGYKPQSSLKLEYIRQESGTSTDCAFSSGLLPGLPVILP
jgi:hypothetical protein